MKNIRYYLLTLVSICICVAPLLGQTVEWQEREFPNAKASIDVVATIKNTATEPCFIMISQETYVKRTQLNDAVYKKLASRFGGNKLSMFLNNSTKRAETDTVNNVPEAFVKKLKPKENFELIVSTTRSQGVEAQRELIKRLIIIPASTLSPLAPNFEEAMRENRFLYEGNRMCLFWGDLSPRFRDTRYGPEDFYDWQRRLRVPLVALPQLPAEPIVPSTDCDFPPQFPGGESALFEYLYDALKGEKDFTNEQGMPGRVTMSFIVEPDGSISNIEDQKSTSGDLTRVATRIVRDMPHWTPGRWRGKVVRARYVLPITCAQ